MLNYNYETHRLYSLLKMNDWQHVGPFSLAKSGFYYTGEADNVRCAFCNLEVRGWEEEDTADGEHRRWNPNCPFLCNDQRVPNIAIGDEMTQEKICRAQAAINQSDRPAHLVYRGVEVGELK
ncbi:Hypothetical predicted protein [Cloeon dipterum]|uniref:Uncharacterized protein n=1 Tax=Cloeon dipterum TaxID=197152 RepID=A0A8S1E2W3_9INSE|nr:Hypothetical predicted protein [Cloeon dipterum]